MRISLLMIRSFTSRITKRSSSFGQLTSILLTRFSSSRWWRGIRFIGFWCVLMLCRVGRRFTAHPTITLALRLSENKIATVCMWVFFATFSLFATDWSSWRSCEFADKLVLSQLVSSERNVPRDSDSIYITEAVRRQ